MYIYGLKLGFYSLTIAAVLALELFTGGRLVAADQPPPSSSPSVSPSVSPSASPSPSPPPTMFENITLSPSFTPDPATMRGISGGAEPASRVAGEEVTATGPCTGYVDQQPDHTMQLTQFFKYLSLQVQSTDDTTLVVRGPGGTWCNDDFSGKNPGISGEWLAGTYQIWVGSYQANTYHPYVMRVTEAH